MSENDIRSKCPEAQASSVLKLYRAGWTFVELEAGGEVMLRDGGACMWVKPDGSAYPN
jgi:hypothetical protein